MSEILLTRLVNQLSPDIDHEAAVAAVLILISREEKPRILYTRRAMHLRNHPGEICFPGGMRERQDENLWATALRETQEEIGLPSMEIELLGSLPPAVTRAGTGVIPFVARFNGQYPVAPTLDELDRIFHVPLDDFQFGIKTRDDHFHHQGRAYRFPVYQYQDYEIWGFTAGVTEQLLKKLYVGQS